MRTGAIVVFQLAGQHPFPISRGVVGPSEMAKGRLIPSTSTAWKAFPMSIATSQVCDVRVVSSAIVASWCPPRLQICGPKDAATPAADPLLQVLWHRVPLEVLDHRAYWHHVALELSPPGKPVDNTFIEAFNGTLRRECLSLHWFLNLAELQHTLNAWPDDYNHHRLHSSLADVPRPSVAPADRLSRTAAASYSPRG